MRNWKIGSSIPRDWSIFFTANDVNEANEKRVILLTVVGPKVYMLLRSLVAPERLEEKSYTDLVETMKNHHNPKLSGIVELHKFSAGSGSRASAFRHLCQS